uniref:Uncharacterized protein n=1 Tax=Salix viminalis TaxID=40686 RepID=A0A6N2LSR0_SALVM
MVSVSGGAGDEESENVIFPYSVGGQRKEGKNTNDSRHCPSFFNFSFQWLSSISAPYKNRGLASHGGKKEQWGGKLTSSSLMFCSRTSVTIIQQGPVDGSNMKKANEHYEEIIQETNYSKSPLRNQKSYDITFCEIRKKTPKCIYEKKKSNYYQQRNRVAAEIAAWKKEGRTNKNLEGAVRRLKMPCLRQY